MAYADFLARLHQGAPVAFSRWGDGEWAAILGHGTQTCDGQRFVEPLREALRNVLRGRPTYGLGMQALARRRYGTQIDAWLQAQQLTALQWGDAGVFHTASVKDQLGPLVAALHHRNVILVGPSHLRTLSLFRIAGYVEVPPSDAFGSLDDLDMSIRCALSEHADSVIAISAGPTGKLLVDRFAATATAIDFGSLWEPYVGVATRTYHARIIDRLRGVR